jgi:16S rRNA (uracil1498-N3)-methyltransferase
MRLIRIYHNRPLSIGQILVIEQQAFVHLIKVLRLKIGQTFSLFNGDGYDYQLSITEINKKNLSANILSSTPSLAESPLKITLYQALSKNDHMDWTLQKATELGVSSIIPFYSERSQGRFKEKQLDKKQQHWKNIIQSACEQCGRGTLPKLNSISNFQGVIQQLSPSANILLLHFDKNTLSFNHIKNDMKEIHLFCGAEGGFTDEEASQLKQKGATVLSLGPRVLRTETAALTAIAILQNKYGDIL